MQDSRTVDDTQRSRRRRASRASSHRVVQGSCPSISCTECTAFASWLSPPENTLVTAVCESDGLIHKLHWADATGASRDTRTNGQVRPTQPSQALQPQRLPQRMVVLLGLPGAGKTTLASQLQETGWVWINQDVMGDRNTCIHECRQALLAGREVVIDRCNFDEQQRSHWVGLAHEGSHLGRVYTIAFHLQTPAAECKRRAMGRADHPTLNGDKVTEVIDRMDTDFRPVQVYEGFYERYRAQAQNDIDNFVRYIGPAFSYPPVTPPQPLDPLTGMPFQASSTSHQGLQSPDSNTVHSLAAQSQAAMSGSLDAAQQQFQRPQQHQQPLPWQQQMPPPAQQQQHQQQQHQSNIVPFQRRPKSSHIPEGLPGSIPGRFLDDASSSQDTRPILLFDLNGTLTSHTAARHSSGKTLIRPGTHHLRRLQEHFRLGIFSSAGMRTVNNVIPMLEAAAGPGDPLFSDRSLILYRAHTEKASADHVAAGGKEWDTIKPLHKWFKHLDRVLLMDDDDYKALPGEKDNMIIIQCWDEEEPEDMHLGLVADIMLQNYQDLDEASDVRLHAKQVSEALAAAVAENVARHSVDRALTEEVQQESDGVAVLLPVSA